jgi:flagellar hook-associated protein 2
MSSIDGLISGMNTTSIIQQLMSLERQPVSRLEVKKLVADKSITALQGLNTKFLAIADLAKKLSASGGWSPVKATVSAPDAAGVTVADGTAPTSLSFKIKSLVAAHQIYSNGTYAAETTLVADPGASISIGYTDANGAPATLNVANHDGTLKGIVDAINGTAASPISARAVKTSDAGDYRLELTAKAAGADSAFTVTGIAQFPGPDMTFAVATQASDAEILFGSSGTPLSITSSSNTLANVVPGVTLVLKQADVGKTINVDIARDTAAISTDVEKLIAAANEFLKEAKSLTAYDAATKVKGLLQGNRTVRDLQNAVLDAVATAVGGKSAITAGVELNKDGTVKFDKVKFEAAYLADPAAVAAIFTGPVGVEGIAQRLATISENATKSTTGLLTQAIDTRRNEIRRIDDSIAMWDIRLSRREAALRRQFAALESALGAAQQQGSWLSSQLASLPKMSSE